MFLNPLAKTWPLEYLTIRPLAHTTNLPFWQDAFRNFPSLPRLRELTLTVHYPRSSAFDMTFWTYMDGLIGQNGIFPRSMHIDIRVTFRSVRPGSGWVSRLFSSFSSLRRSRVVKLWGNSKYGSCSALLPLIRLSPRLLALIRRLWPSRSSPLMRVPSLMPHFPVFLSG